MTIMKRREYFYEVQQFRQWWVWLIVAMTTLGILVFNVMAFYHQIGRGVQFGDTPMSDQGLIFFGVFSLIFMAGLVVMFYHARLETRVERYGISYRYFPFICSWRFISKDQITRWAVKSYFPSGYGIRLGFRFTTYNVSGTNGLELILANRRNIRLGTRKPGELRHALEKMTNSEEM